MYLQVLWFVMKNLFWQFKNDSMSSYMHYVQHIKVSKVKWNETKQTDFLLKIGDLSYITRFTEKIMNIAIEMTLLNSARVQISFPLSCRPDVICRFKYEKSWNQEITNVRRHIYRQICDFPDYISIYHFLLNSW